MKKILATICLLVLSFGSLAFTQDSTATDTTRIFVENDSIDLVLDSDKERLVKEAEVVYIKESLILDIDGDKIGDAIITEDNELFFTFIKADMQKINDTYRIVALMEQVIEKYGLENSSYIEIIDNLENKLVEYEGKIEVLEGKNMDKDEEVSQLYEIIDRYKEAEAKQDEIDANNKEQISNLEKENKKLKLFSKGGAIGTIGFIVMIIIFL